MENGERRPTLLRPVALTDTNNTAMIHNSPNMIETPSVAARGSAATTNTHKNATGTSRMTSTRNK